MKQNNFFWLRLIKIDIVCKCPLKNFILNETHNIGCADKIFNGFVNVFHILQEQMYVQVGKNSPSVIFAVFIYQPQLFLQFKN